MIENNMSSLPFLSRRFEGHHCGVLCGESGCRNRSHPVYVLLIVPGYRRKSTITETEDVSYVSSAYVPQCLRYGGRPTLSNAHRAHESAVNTDNIRDELDEVITLNSVSIIVAEYIPFGANQV